MTGRPASPLSSLGDAYALERELGGGGMARVVIVPPAASQVGRSDQADPSGGGPRTEPPRPRRGRGGASRANGVRTVRTPRLSPRRPARIVRARPREHARVRA